MEATFRVQPDSLLIPMYAILITENTTLLMHMTHWTVYANSAALVIPRIAHPGVELLALLSVSAEWERAAHPFIISQWHWPARSILT